MLKKLSVMSKTSAKLSLIFKRIFTQTKLIIPHDMNELTSPKHAASSETQPQRSN